MYAIDPPPSDSDAEQSNDLLAVDESGLCMLPAAASAACKSAPTALPSKEGKKEETAPATAAVPLMSRSEEQREEPAVDSMEVDDNVVSHSSVIIRYASAIRVQLAGQVSNVIIT